MTDQRCPMCGKPNPEDAETCEFCQARLKPLVIQPPADDSEPAGSSPLDDSPAGSESSLPDWLQDLKPEGEADFEAEPDAAVPDWLSGPEENTAPAGTSELPDWLSDIRKGDSGDSFELEQAAATEDTFAAAFDQPPAAPSDDAGTDQADTEPGGLPDWLSDQPAGSQPEPSTQGFPGQAEPDTSDWLQRIRSRKQDETKGPFFEEEGTPAEEDTPPQFTPEQPAGPFEAQDEGLPDWLAGSTRPEAPEPAVPAEEVPDWLSSVSPQHGEDRPSGEQPFQSDDWLKEIERSAAFAVDDEESTAQPPPAEPAEEIPDWLARIDQPQSEKPQGAVPALIFENEDDLGPFNQESETPGFAAPELAQEPDWISQVPEDEAPAQKPAAPEGVPEEDLEKADLPGWLEAMRPVEAAAPNAPMDDANSGTIETTGPLQGMRGVLPAQPAFGRLKKPAAQSLKLSITDSQKSHIALLEGLLSNEGEPKSLPKPAIINSQAVTRLLIALVMILAVVGPMFYPGMVARFAVDDVPQEVNNVAMIVGGLAAGEPVLVAFDYESGYAFEVESAASILLSQVASRGAVITAVSTNISGPVLAQRWLESYRSQPDANAVSFYNLGFIPAGPAGLLGFAENPSRVMPYDLQPEYVWNKGVLAGVQSIADYQLVVVLTDNSDSARAWIEQVQPLLNNGDVPLVFASSAQVEPVLRPYYDTLPRQVDGMVAGLAGGVAYESLTGLPGKAGTAWDAMGTGVLLAAILILAGGFINGALATISMVKKQAAQEEK